MNLDTRNIYVASLTDYNNGMLHGVWIEVDDKDADDIKAEVDAMLAASPTAKRTGDVAEEWAIHDYSGFPRDSIGEYTSFDDVVKLAVALEEHGEDAFGAFISAFGTDIDEAIEHFADVYQGEYKSEEDYAATLLEDAGMLSELPDWAINYFDYDAYARDLFINDMVSEPSETGGIHVFYRNW